MNITPALTRDDCRMKRCTRCGGEDLLDDTIDDERVFGPYRFVIRLPAQVCATCSEDYVWGGDLEALTTAVTRAVVDGGIADPEALHWLRRRAGLRSEDLAALLGVAPAVVARWEGGQHPIDRPHLALLGLLAVDALEGRTTTADQLRAMASPAPSGVVFLSGMSPEGTSRRDAA